MGSFGFKKHIYGYYISVVIPTYVVHMLGWINVIQFSVLTTGVVLGK